MNFALEGSSPCHEWVIRTSSIAEELPKMSELRGKASHRAKFVKEIKVFVVNAGLDRLIKAQMILPSLSRS